MDIEYRIRENQISYIHRIDIRGNTITKDVVIRREISVKPGQVFNGLKVRRSRQRLYNTGFFDQVVIDPIDTDIPGEKDVMIQVHEKKTGEFLFGVGYSSIDDFIGFAEIGLGNFDLFNPPYFQGGGQKIRLRGEFGNKRSNYEISFTEPWLFGIPLSFGVDLYTRSRYWSEYDEKRTGGDLRLRKRLTGFAEAGLIYRLEQVDISDIDSDAYWAIQSERGKNWISSITPSLTRDSRDNNYIPTGGMRNSISCKIAGGVLGGDKNFIKTRFNNSFYLSISNLFRGDEPRPMMGRDPSAAGHVLGFRFDMGTEQTYEDTDIVPVYERFYLGGANTIRGFRYREVGPHDENDEPIGGDSMVMGSVEYTFPIVSVIRGAFFFDIGNVWSDKDWKQDDQVFSNNWWKSLNSGAGIGLRLYLPIGPIKLDYGWPLRYAEDGWNDTGGRFHFNIGYAF
jgi:outer membrane protein insertion porin family